ncbi:hypothetical protein UF75_2698 [Desulfosporosinus sp. I2]|uniref:DUF2247 family protein n=1 Tax=Desulfosporosinus sp. I2 TaxID=1617025 RepID=UPI00061EC274|nr:DUF2247 family protein [Desulfosporosinus sp. I2]KJR46897.1 hypothetical protein UF75_2698 [Desulfosporosinus sp. I2]
MVSPTNKITENQIRKLVSESKNPLNPLNMVFTYVYVTNLVPLNWNDILFAIENNFLAHQTAIEHGLEAVQKNENVPEEVLELAFMLQGEAKLPYDVYQLVNKLATSHNPDNASDSREKFLYVSLNWVYEHKDDYCNPIEVVDILCDEINYPDEVKNLISFMPTSESETNSSDSTTERLLGRLLRYLENQRNRWA